MDITRNLRTSKRELIAFFREKSETYKQELNVGIDHKEKAKALNSKLVLCKDELIQQVKDKAKAEQWDKVELLECILMITYCNYVVMLETRNSVWSYEYMAFSRRIGELWEPFCKLPFECPINELELFTPPLFADIKQRAINEYTDKVNGFDIPDEQKRDLINSYLSVWDKVTCGEIQMDLDLHFKIGDMKYVVDFKSGFGSNEKGNTNRLLLVAQIYHDLNDNYNPLIFVRSTDNNSYFNTLKNSGIWQAYSGNATYAEINKYSGYNIKRWIDSNINWEDDLSQEFVTHLRANNLLQYLTW